MKRRLTILLLMLLAVGGGGLKAQVRIHINGSGTHLLDENGGLYFENDTMRVVDNSGTSVYALDEVQVITLESAPQEGISEVDATMQMLPNPAQDRIAVLGIGDRPQTLTIYSTAGVKLMEQTATDNTVIDISHLPEGMYVLRCGSLIGKFVKQL